MKATLTFNLDNIDEQMAHLRCIKATRMALALWEWQRFIKNIDEVKSKQILIDDFADLLIRYDINLDNLIQ